MSSFENNPACLICTFQAFVHGHSISKCLLCKRSCRMWTEGSGSVLSRSHNMTSVCIFIFVFVNDPAGCEERGLDWCSIVFTTWPIVIGSVYHHHLRLAFIPSLFIEWHCPSLLGFVAKKDYKPLSYRHHLRMTMMKHHKCINGWRRRSQESRGPIALKLERSLKCFVGNFFISSQSSFHS